MAEQAFLRIPTIKGVSQNPAFPEWIPIKSFWFGESYETGTAARHKASDAITFTAGLSGISKVTNLYDSRNGATPVAGKDTPAEFVGLASDASRLGEASPPARWPRVRVYDLHLYLREAIVIFVSQQQDEIRFTLRGSELVEGSLYRILVWNAISSMTRMILDIFSLDIEMSFIDSSIWLSF